MASFVGILKQYKSTFWIANTIELFERMAWYGFFFLFANYLTKSTDLGGLEFTQSQKGMIMGIGTGILYFLPIITGAIADRYGYKKILTLAFVVYISAFLAFPLFDTFTGVFMVYIYLAIGAALFKPVISATIAKTTNDENSSMGFGIFYMMVNMGAFIGPLITMPFQDNLFYIVAAMISVNFILLLFYIEPDRKHDSKPLGESLKTIYQNIITVGSNLQFMVFLLIIAGFWTMYNQLFFTLPVFVEMWVDSSHLYAFYAEHFPIIAENYGHNGQIQPEFITNSGAFFIIAFQLIISYLVMKLRPLNAMITGIIIATIGMSLTLISQSAVFVIVAIFIFAIGEMSASPKITEYIGRIAPKDKKALYMGFAYVPMFLGNILAGIVSGVVYEKYSDKYKFAEDFAAANNLIVDDKLTNNQMFLSLAEQQNITPLEFTNLLWQQYHPSNFWMVIAAIGGLAIISLFFYDRHLQKSLQK
ncbi:MAG: MFS transporter [Bacteroidetes bacterium 4572_112]|nr:MAG: MFS transporter [Bacteroidetes bacterium 4572_112]